jgi:hypothetical protein
MGAQTPDAGTEEDRGVFARGEAVVAADAEGGPFFVGGGGGVVVIEPCEDVGELVVQDFLQADEGGWDVAGGEGEFGEEEGGADGPGTFAGEGVCGCVPDVMGVNSDWEGGGG